MRTSIRATLAYRVRNRGWWIALEQAADIAY